MELVITITVLTILTMGVLPLVKVSVKRQKEQQLRDTLRQIRMAIDEFHRDTVGMVCTAWRSRRNNRRSNSRDRSSIRAARS